MIWTLVIIGAIIFFMQPQETKKEASADISTATLTRSFSAALVKAGTTFTSTYTASNYGVGSWGVLFSDTAGGGCSPASFYTTFFGPDQTNLAKTFTSPSTAGVCTFSGTSTFAGSTDKTITGSTTVNICQDACTSGQVGCADAATRWTCDISNVCGVQINTVCQSYETCNAGACNPQCTTLRTSAWNAALAWVSNPTTATKSTAVSAIILWASNC